MTLLIKINIHDLGFKDVCVCNNQSTKSTTLTEATKEPGL